MLIGKLKMGWMEYVPKGVPVLKYSMTNECAVEMSSEDLVFCCSCWWLLVNQSGLLFVGHEHRHLQKPSWCRMLEIDY